MKLPKDWKNYFDDIILMRGLEYYEDGAVSNLVNGSEKVEATVSGTYNYKVKLEKKGKSVQYGLHLPLF